MSDFRKMRVTNIRANHKLLAQPQRGMIDIADVQLFINAGFGLGIWTAGY